MSEDEVHRYILETFAGVATQDAYGYTFYFFGEDRKLPFATLAHEDNDWDRVSDLDRPGVFRLNVGVRHATYRERFGPQPKNPAAGGVVDTGHDFAKLDELMPHPSYAPQSWLCVVQPSAATFEQVKPLLREAYDMAVEREEKRQRREPGPS